MRPAWPSMYVYPRSKLQLPLKTKVRGDDQSAGAPSSPIVLDNDLVAWLSSRSSHREDNLEARVNPIEKNEATLQPLSFWPAQLEDPVTSASRLRYPYPIPFSEMRVAIPNRIDVSPNLDDHVGGGNSFEVVLPTTLMKKILLNFSLLDRLRKLLWEFHLTETDVEIGIGYNILSTEENDESENGIPGMQARYCDRR